MTHGRYTVVVALDASDAASSVADYAFDLAGRHERPDVHLLSVIDLGPRKRTSELPTAALQEHDRRLRATAEESVASFGWAERPELDWRVRVHVRGGLPVEEILGLAAEAVADLVVIGPHASEHPRFGRTLTEQLLKQARCPVLVARPTDWDEVADAEQACPACEATRRDTEGEHWFCTRHMSELPIHSVGLRGGSIDSPRGASLWF